MFDGDIAAGPVPLLFAANPDEAAASIAAEPAKAHFDLSKVTFISISLLFSKLQFCSKNLYGLDLLQIWRTFLQHETLTPDMAKQFVKDPR